MAPLAVTNDSNDSDNIDEFGDDDDDDDDDEAGNPLPQTESTVTEPSIVDASSSSSSEESDTTTTSATPLSIVVESVCEETAPANGSRCTNPGVRCGPFVAVVGETRVDATAIQYPQCTCQLDRWVCGPWGAK